VMQINAQEEVDEMPEAQVKAAMEAERLEFDRYKARLDAKTKVMVAQISAGVQVADDFEPVGLFEPVRPAEPVEQLPPEPDLTQVALLQALEGFTEAITELRRPKTIVRGPDGRALGIQ
jgi:hypothetical protein